MLLKLAIALFIFGAIFGLIVLVSILRNQTTPKPMVAFHGLFVVTALTLVLITYFTGQASKILEISIGLFVIAALGGLTLLTIDLLKRPIPKWLAVLHPIVAASGLLFLIYYALPTLA